MTRDDYRKIQMYLDDIERIELIDNLKNTTPGITIPWWLLTVCVISGATIWFATVVWLLG